MCVPPRRAEGPGGGILDCSKSVHLELQVPVELQLLPGLG